MIDILQTQFFQLIEPQSINAGAATSFYLDTQNVDWARIVMCTGAIGAADMSSVGVTECETSGGSYTAITNSGATVTATDDGKIVITDVDYRNKGTHKRFLKVDMTAGAVATLVAAYAVVQPKKTPTSISDVGAGCLAGATKAVLAWNQV